MQGFAVRPGPRGLCSLLHGRIYCGIGSWGSLVPDPCGLGVRFHGGLVQISRRVLQPDLVLGQIGPGPHSTWHFTAELDPGWVCSWLHAGFARLSLTPMYPRMQHPPGGNGDRSGPRPPGALSEGRHAAAIRTPPRDPSIPFRSPRGAPRGDPGLRPAPGRREPRPASAPSRPPPPWPPAACAPPPRSAACPAARPPAPSSAATVSGDTATPRLGGAARVL